MTEYDCIFSGRSAKPEQCIEGPEDSELDDMPAGWIEIKITRRFMNPLYLRMLKIRENMTEGQIARLEAEQGPLADEQKEDIALYNVMVTAGAEDHEMFAKFIEAPMHFYVSSPDEDPQVRSALLKALKALNLEPEQIEELIG
jgi:hypothetical protein